jgi:hypothetical protein
MMFPEAQLLPSISATTRAHVQKESTTDIPQMTPNICHDDSPNRPYRGTTNRRRRIGLDVFVEQSASWGLMSVNGEWRCRISAPRCL